MKRINILYITLLIVAFILSVPGYCQTEYYIYSYDASGNRELRQVDQSKSAKIKNESSSDSKNEEIIIEETLDEFSIKIFPNPTDGMLNINISNLGEQQASMLLFNMQGKMIYNNKLKSSSSKLDLRKQPSGIYILKLLIGENSTEWKIIKE